MSASTSASTTGTMAATTVKPKQSPLKIKRKASQRTNKEIESEDPYEDEMDNEAGEEDDEEHKYGEGEDDHDEDEKPDAYYSAQIALSDGFLPSKQGTKPPMAAHQSVLASIVDSTHAALKETSTRPEDERIGVIPPGAAPSAPKRKSAFAFDVGHKHGAFLKRTQRDTPEELEYG
ncbi:hypothetical protein BKA70DRAFT_1223792 [Coprinopsis sp. MPI-PUGE-AT-0042]|nr:hypothetical protein BKA70DRAFT_1223792 [Coprinopsis sp. MPI-PUGE-AT-0042]